MIIDGIISIAYVLFLPIIDLFPDADETAISTISDAIYNVKNFMGSFNWIFPVDTFFFCLNITIGVVVGIGLLRLIRWIASLLTANILH